MLPGQLYRNYLVLRKLAYTRLWNKRLNRVLFYAKINVNRLVLFDFVNLYHS